MKDQLQRILENHRQRELRDMQEARIDRTLRRVAIAVVVLVLIALWSSCTVTRPVTATSNIMGAKTGTATAVRVLGVWVKGDASIATAARSADITRIATVDQRTTSVLGLYYRTTCIVNGYQDNIPPILGRP